MRSHGGISLRGVSHHGANANLMAGAAAGDVFARADSPPRFSLKDPPDTWQKGQIGTNQCIKKYGKSSPDSLCQTVHINSVTDFCLWAPPTGPAEIGDTETEEVAYCTKDGYGTRLIPDNTFNSIHFLKTKNYVEVLGTGNFTVLNIVKGNTGGELDPHGADGTGNPIGGLVYTEAFTGKPQQIDEWMMFISDSIFCFRACNPDDPLAWQRCQHIYDTEGCDWNMPSSVGYDPTAHTFDSCEGDDPYFPGINDGATFHHGDAKTPDPHPPPVLKNCQNAQSPTNGYKTPDAPDPNQVVQPPRPGPTPIPGGGGNNPHVPSPTNPSKPQAGGSNIKPNTAGGTRTRTRLGSKDTGFEALVSTGMVLATFLAAAAVVFL
ncbi:unnamed protein product [Tilletia controversa]|uniref:Uncharacterized protein n=3 Tax=Tilletia TaxID=13289 RepID=A0A8X7MQ55_9BASI|nr:hypothetical protein CF336_g7192 [Tilletia laevis]KAE8187551.1 hypothetical protein CF328_g6881 [Tilletia controversa]KAE8249852.1 hypothetical protein A4X03_0g6552 [Tilletia caries]KAE8188460.1 hypothetical protein CF335_g6889 [Tilletia laevis]KAE8245540.1 hypothetical protein A4X06_0g5617 [Tilletia controversa]